MSRKVVEDYLASLEALQEGARRGLAPMLDRLNESEGRAGRLDHLYEWGRLARDEYRKRLAEILAARQDLETERRKRQKEIDEYDGRARQIEQVRAALADGALFVDWNEGLKVEVPDENRVRLNGKVRKGREVLNEIVSGRFERPMSLHKLLESLDIRAVVHGDRIEVLGAFTPVKIAAGEVSLRACSWAGARWNYPSCSR